MSKADYTELLSQLEALKEQGRAMGGPEGVARQHSKGRFTARERIDMLLDANTFVEYGVLASETISVPGRPDRNVPAAGVVVGAGRVNGRRVLVIADDGTIAGGARGLAGLRKVQKFRLLAGRRETPIVFLLEASAGRVDDQMGAKFANFVADPHETLFGDLISNSGRVPVVSAVLGSAVGGAAFTAALSDFTTMAAGTSHMAVAGPPVVSGATGRSLSFDELGGADIHTGEVGTADHFAEDEAAAIAAVRRYLSYMPQSSKQLPPHLAPVDGPRLIPNVYDIVPTNRRRAYDVRRVLAEIADEGSLFEIKARFGRSLVTSFGRLHGHVVAFVANQPLHKGGVLDAPAAHKMEHFLLLADAYHIPLVFLIDTPGFMVGPESERAGLVTGAARLLSTHHKITVPKISIVLRKAYGLAYSIMGGTPIVPDTIAAWPSASFGVMDPAPAANVLFSREIRESADPEAKRNELIEMIDRQSSPFHAASAFGIDEVIDPAETRNFLIERLDVLADREVRPDFKHPVLRV